MRLLTWNIQWGRGMDGCVDLERIVDTIRRHGEFDVICLQEVARNFAELEGSRGEDDMAALAEMLPGYQGIYGAATDLPTRHGRRKRFGNALFCRLPIGQVFRHRLPWPVDAGVPSMQRMLLEAVIEAPFGPVRVMTTHLEYYSRLQREAQIDAIRALHAEACAQARAPRPAEDGASGPFAVYPRPCSAILCGDMNFPANAPERARILAPIDPDTPVLCDAWEVIHPGVPHAPTAGIHKVDWLDTPSCFDFVFVSEDLAPRLNGMATDPDTAASDHQPVWIELAD